MRPQILRLTFLLISAGATALHAATPPLLEIALQRWSAGAGDLALTQRTRIFSDDGSVKVERIERYDPSLPDNQRWRLLEVDGKPATEEQRAKWEGRKNGKPRKKAAKAATDYLDLEHAVLVKDSPATARFEVGVRPETSRLLDVEKVAVLITVEKEHGTVAHIAATLREPVRVLLGLAKITDFDLDVGIDPPRGKAESARTSGQLNASGTARAVMSKFGDPTEYLWSDFKRVTAYGAPKSAPLPATPRP